MSKQSSSPRTAERVMALHNGHAVRKVTICYSLPCDNLVDTLQKLNSSHATGQLVVHYGQGTPSAVEWQGSNIFNDVPTPLVAQRKRARQS